VSRELPFANAACAAAVPCEFWTKFKTSWEELSLKRVARPMVLTASVSAEPTWPEFIRSAICGAAGRQTS